MIHGRNDARNPLVDCGADGGLKGSNNSRASIEQLIAERLLRDGTERIFGFTAVAADWDGRWTIVIARTPETERAARHVLRTRLRWAGFGNVMPGVWLSPRSDRGGEVRQILAEAGLPDGYLFTAERQGGGSLAAMVGNAWDLDQLARGYDEFVEAFSGKVTPLSPDPLVRVIDLVHAWRRYPVDRPGPPGPVPARPVARHRRRRAVRPAARRVGRRRHRRVEAAADQDVTLGQADAEGGHPVDRGVEGAGSSCPPSSSPARAVTSACPSRHREPSTDQVHAGLGGETARWPGCRTRPARRPQVRR